ncbi:MAG TPA: pilus assembly protein PilC, partial [Verrucomicrobiales bacterium]|nr:pilus assembly protein PilC [Verrucomicrobiales bacterium]
MPLFAYKALKRGQVTNGQLEASDRREALRLMDRMGLQPVKVSEAGASS